MSRGCHYWYLTRSNFCWTHREYPHLDLWWQNLQEWKDVHRTRWLSRLQTLWSVGSNIDNAEWSILPLEMASTTNCANIISSDNSHTFTVRSQTYSLSTWVPSTAVTQFAVLSPITPCINVLMVLGCLCTSPVSIANIKLQMLNISGDWCCDVMLVRWLLTNWLEQWFVFCVAGSVVIVWRTGHTNISPGNIEQGSHI